MTLTFADTHNMIAYLIKSNASEGFNQIIDCLNGSSIKYALTVNPNIYVSCIKQFWTTVAVKKVNDVTRLQALVDKKKVVVTEATIRDALHLDDAEGVECLSNEEIFYELARIGYKKPSTKLTFYKAFLSSQWKFLIHTILQCMSAKRTSWNEFSSSMGAVVICMSTVGDLSTHTTKYTSPALTQKVFANMRRVGKGYSGVETPLFEGMIVAQGVGEDVADEANVDDVTADEVHAKDVTASVIVEDVQVADIDESADDQGRKAESQAKIYKIDLEHAKKRNLNLSKSKHKEDNVVKRYQALKRKPQTEAQARKNMMIYLRNVAGFKMDYFKGMTYDDIRLIFEKKFNSNVAFLTKIKEQMDEEDSRARKRLSESQDDKAAKKQKLDEEVPVVDYEIYNKHNKPYYKIKRADGSHQLYLSFLTLLRNFDREDLEALWRLVKERFATTKLKKFSDDFLLTTLEAMFEKPDIQAQIWKNQRSVHGQAKVKSWKLLESCGVQITIFIITQLILLVERRYPLTRFTLDQMLNNVRLEVEGESEVSLELLRFGVDAAEESQGKHAK
nr:hypothetical protein [Tanacetum cinerariifolium]